MKQMLYATALLVGMLHASESPNVLSTIKSTSKQLIPGGACLACSTWCCSEILQCCWVDPNPPYHGGDPFARQMAINLQEYTGSFIEWAPFLEKVCCLAPLVAYGGSVIARKGYECCNNDNESTQDKKD